MNLEYPSAMLSRTRCASTLASRSLTLTAALVLSLAILPALASGAAATKAPLTPQTARCVHVIQHKGKVSVATILYCESSTLSVTHPCPSGSTTVFVTWHSRTYALTTNRRPNELPKQYGMGTISHSCAHRSTTPSPVPVAAPLDTTTSQSPLPTTTVPPPPPPPTTAPAASCTPLSDEGTCYEPGEYCRDSDHGASGVAGDGEPITCQDNDGWRWEPT